MTCRLQTTDDVRSTIARLTVAGLMTCIVSSQSDSNTTVIPHWSMHTMTRATFCLRTGDCQREKEREREEISDAQN